MIIHILVVLKLYNYPLYSDSCITTVIVKRRAIFSQINTYSFIDKKYAGLCLLKKNTFLKSRCFSSAQPSTPFYANADTQKLSILNDNKGKAGIYL
jgi:hypothetical protein